MAIGDGGAATGGGGVATGGGAAPGDGHPYSCSARGVRAAGRSISCRSDFRGSSCAATGGGSRGSGDGAGGGGRHAATATAAAAAAASVTSQIRQASMGPMLAPAAAVARSTIAPGTARRSRRCIRAARSILPGAHFTERECTVGYLRVLRDVLREKGIPQTVYGDRHGSLSRNDKRWSLEEELAGRREPTQVKRALDDLGVEMIYARSPQAKGRIERVWGTLQDRLVAEMRLAGASTRGEANKVLREYLRLHNQLFALPAAEAQLAWRSAPTDHVLLLELCALQYVKKVSKSNTVRVDGRVLDIPRSNGNYAGKAVTVKHLLSGQYRIHFGGKCIAWCEGERPRSPAPGPRTELGFTKRERLQRERQQVSAADEERHFYCADEG